MTLEVTNRVRVVENLYDGDTKTPLFQGEVATITEVAVGDPYVYYLAFDNPDVNKFTDEAADTTWPFYVGELEKVDA